jgi:hypothetical protein
MQTARMYITSRVAGVVGKREELTENTKTQLRSKIKEINKLTSKMNDKFHTTGGEVNGEYLRNTFSWTETIRTKDRVEASFNGLLNGAEVAEVIDSSQATEYRALFGAAVKTFFALNSQMYVAQIEALRG